MNHAPFVVLLMVWLRLFTLHAQPQPAASSRGAVDQYHGTRVSDDYRWLENGTDPAVRAWSAEQNKRARAYLDGLPIRREIEDRLTRLLTNSGTDYSSLMARRGGVFLLKFDPQAQQPALITAPSLTNLSQARVVFDPNRVDPSGGTSIDWYVPSLDGRFVAISFSENGSELGALHVYETATGRSLGDIVPRAQGPTAGGSAAWNADGTGFFYTRYPGLGERPVHEASFYQQIYFHRLGTPAEQDRYELGKDFPKIAEIQLEASPDGKWILATVANGDGGEYEHFLRSPAGSWSQVTRFEDQVTRASFGRDPLYIEAGADNGLYLLSHKNAPRGQVLRAPLDQPLLANARLIVPERATVIQEIKPAASGIYLVLQNGGPTELALFDYSDQSLSRPRDDDRSFSSIDEVVVTKADEVFYRISSFTHPFAWMRFDRTESKETSFPTGVAGHSAAPFEDIEVVRETAKSRDGAKVPLRILVRRGLSRTGDMPTVLTGYGGFGISTGPDFDVARRLWLDQGGVIAIANIRGGGEFGEGWHSSGNLTNKQNVFDDFAACAERLFELKYTSPERLAIEGGSNGGLLMGAALTQHPALARAVVSSVGIYDMLRVELDPNGQFNVTEYGSVTRPEQFRALYSYSPYHHVTNRVAYPAVLMLTGDNDGRVNPAHSRKMIARLQAATSSGHPVLLRTSSKAGHGIGSALNEKIQQLADIYAFLTDQLGLDYSLIDRGPWAGAATPNSAVIKAKLIREGLRSRLALSKSPSLADPIYLPSAPSHATNFNMVGWQAERLAPDTQYYYAVEVEGRLDRRHAGQFKTFPPPGPASFSVAFASCARTGSTLDTFDRIRENHPLFFMHTGDFHYLDIHTNSQTVFAAAYNSVLASPPQAELFRSLPIVYIWDDHDFAGNNSDGRAAAHPAALRAYDLHVPHYPLVFPGPYGAVNQSFSVGRVKFILTDLRSQRDDSHKHDGPEKTMMGPRQKEWFKNELLAANGKYPLICWVSSVPWLGEPRTNYYHWIHADQYGYFHHSNYVGLAEGRTNRNAVADDHWSVYAAERREIADFIKNNHIQGVCILHGDSHMLAADDGSHSDYATGGGAPLPVMCAAPLDQAASIKGGYYSQGVYRVRPGEGGFGLLNISDVGDRIDVSYSGRNNKNEEKISLKFSVPAPPVSTPSSRP